MRNAARSLSLLALVVSVVLMARCGGSVASITGNPRQGHNPYNDPYLLDEVQLPAEYASGELLVLFQKDVPQEVIDQINANVGAEVLGVTSVTKVYRLKLPEGISVPEGVRRYAVLGEVAEVSPNYFMSMTLIPNDPYFAQQWNYHNRGQFIPGFGSGTPDKDIDAPEAWDIGGAGSFGIIIAILDTGIDQDHPELSGKIIWQANHIGAPSGVDDFQGHGTHVAGTAAAIGNNGFGVVGACWNCALMNMKVLDDTGAGTAAALIAAIDDAHDGDFLEPHFGVHPNAHIMSASLSGSGACSSVAGLQTAIDNAVADGLIFVAAAGNNNQDLNTSPRWPATCNNTVTVASTTNTDARSIFSNYGVPIVEIAAPGSAILSTFPNHPNQIGPRWYGIISGTSMATPLVSGALGLIWSQYPALTRQQVIDRMCLRADPIAGTGTNWTCGRLNLHRAIQ